MIHVRSNNKERIVNVRTDYKLVLMSLYWLTIITRSYRYLSIYLHKYLYIYGKNIEIGGCVKNNSFSYLVVYQMWQSYTTLSFEHHWTRY